MIENYERIRDGHWHQIQRTGPGPTYSIDYMNYYNTIPSREMSAIRYGVIRKYVGNFTSICDFGYGNGAFLSYCHSEGYDCFGYDISDCPTPKGVTRVHDLDNLEVDVLTFFDSIEHIEDSDLVTFLNNKKNTYAVISVPWLHECLGPEAFRNWKHRKPNEHFHHFDSHGIIGLLNDANYEVLHIGNEEDAIRKSVTSLPNILTVVARRK